MPDQPERTATAPLDGSPENQSTGPRQPSLQPQTVDDQAADLQDAPLLPSRPTFLELGAEIARGGMGAVYRARDKVLGRDLAVKVLLDRHADRPDVLRRFAEEARAAGQLQHPGVPPVYEVGVLPDGRPFIAMKLIQGRTLAALLADRPSPGQDLPRFLAVFEQVCQTLAYAHSQGVIHRDLKPLNVMVGAFGEVQVMDWGLAKVLRGTGRTASATALQTAGSGGGESQAGSVLGTPAYMPPEQARGEVRRLDERADVFGLGAILCEVLTGRPPYTAEGGRERLRQAERGDLIEAFARLDGCGAEAELVALARACLAAAAADRPRDAGEVAAKVTAYRAGVEQRLREAEVERAAAQARAEEARAKARAERRARRLTLGLAATVLALVVLGGGGGAWWWWRRAETINAVDASLAEVRSHLEQDKVPEARQALERAEGRLGGGGPPNLWRRVEQARTEVDLAHELDKIRLDVSAPSRTASTMPPSSSRGMRRPLRAINWAWIPSTLRRPSRASGPRRSARS
jgi:serine/threonine-protein kinase